MKVFYNRKRLKTFFYLELSLIKFNLVDTQKKYFQKEIRIIYI
jgi:hypothetical protein